MNIFMKVVSDLDINVSLTNLTDQKIRWKVLLGTLYEFDFYTNL